MKMSSHLIGFIALFLGLWQLYSIIAKLMTQPTTSSLIAASMMLGSVSIFFITHGFLYLREPYRTKWTISEYFHEGISGDWMPTPYKIIMMISFSIFLFASTLYLITIFAQLNP